MFVFMVTIMTVINFSCHVIKCLLDALYGRLLRACDAAVLADADSALWAGDFSVEPGDGRLGDGPP